MFEFNTVTFGIIIMASIVFACLIAIIVLGIEDMAKWGKNDHIIG